MCHFEKETETKRTKCTKKNGVEAPVWHVLVHNQLLVVFEANAYEPHEVLVLKLGNQYQLCFQLFYSLCGAKCEPLHCNFLAVRKDSLRVRSEKALNANDKLN